MNKFISIPFKLLAFLLITMVRFYQVCISPLLPPACIYQPSCSQYYILAVKKYGPVIGSWKGICRICRCHPFCRGGYDPP